MLITKIFIYPVKSCQGISLEEAEVTSKGLFLDREFMIVNNSGKFITQRQFSNLATIEIKIDQDNNLILSQNQSNTNSFTLIPKTEGNKISVEIWRDQTIAIDQGDEVANWLKSALKIDDNIRLVKQSSQYIRAIDPQYSLSDNAPVSFADGYPLLLTNTASLNQINNKIKEQYQNNNNVALMEQFRPNVVVETQQPFAEDYWRNIDIGNLKFCNVKPCTRCIITTTNQSTGIRNSLQEPLKTLSKFRNFKNIGILFGVNLIPQTLGKIKVGDELKIH